MTQEYYEKKLAELNSKSNWSEEHRQLCQKWQKQCAIRLEWLLRYARSHNVKFV